MTKKQFNIIIIGTLTFFILLLAIVVIMNIKNTTNLRGILTKSIKSQLIGTSLAAREILDIPAFIEYDNADVAQQPQYQETLARLRNLGKNVGAKYIYALKKQGDKYVFVFDTDTENETIFIDYKLSPVHQRAFSGKNDADIMNVADEYGDFHTGAVPILYKGQVVGIISVDIEDAYLKNSINAAFTNAVMLVAILVITMLVMLFIVVKLLRYLQKMHYQLERQALYDNVTGLPNRQHLMNYLAQITNSAGTQLSFALLFIDLDNFKKVNDNAGHDAGDELLKAAGNYLDQALENSKSFRPAAGHLNIAARVGGDEFVQVVNGVDSKEKADDIAQYLLENFQQENLNRYITKYNVSMSIGIALYPYHTDNYHVLIKYADMAMYQAKHAGKNQYRVYSDDMMQKNNA